jgi:hypothetical protein
VTKLKGACDSLQHTINTKLVCVPPKMSSYWNLYTCRDGVWAIDTLSSTDYDMAVTMACKLLERGTSDTSNVLMTYGILKTPYENAILVSRVRDDSTMLIVDNVHVCNDSSLYVKCGDVTELQYYENAMILSPGLLVRLEVDGVPGTIKLIGPYA